MKVPYFDLNEQTWAIRDELDEAIERVMDSAQFCLGPEVEAFEDEFGAYIGKRSHCVAVNSGTSALHLAMILRGIGPGDEVILPAMTFVATAWAVSYVGATPVFVDIDPHTMNIDPDKIQAAITHKTRMVIAVHLYGQPAEIDAIAAICMKNSLYFLEDCCQAHGATYKGLRVGGTHWDSAFSFYPGKNLGACGEGGALILAERHLVNRAKALREHGSTERYFHNEVGYNYRMDAIQGAILRVKLRHLTRWTERRREIAFEYKVQLASAGLPLMFQDEAQSSPGAWHLFVLRHPERDRIRKFLETRGVGTGLHYPVPLHLQKCYAHLRYREGDLPVAEKVARECFSLPIWPGLTNEQVDYVVACLKEYFK